VALGQSVEDLQQIFYKVLEVKALLTQGIKPPE